MSLKNWWHGKLAMMIVRAIPDMDGMYFTTLSSIIDKEKKRRYSGLVDGNNCLRGKDAENIVLKISASKLPSSRKPLKTLTKKKKAKLTKRG